MFDAFFKRRRAKKAWREWQRSNLGQVLAMHTSQYFSKYPRLADLAQDVKEKMVREFYERVFNLGQAENPFLKMREVLASLVLGYAGYQVLCLTEEEKREAEYANCPFISGQLYRHIDKIVPAVDELRELKWKHPYLTAEELISFCNDRCVHHLYFLNGFNYVRSEFDDWDKQKDWLRPFIESALIWEESQIREKIGLDSLLPDRLDALKYSTFMNMVVNGFKNPFYEWEKAWVLEKT